jgi:hypothetical protein
VRIDQRTFELKLLPGARALLALHGSELPQRDDLCGAFCGALALRAAGIHVHDSEPLDQDAVARAAGSIISALTDPDILPEGELGRRDYRLALPMVEDSSVSGTTAAGLVAAIATLSEGALEPIPYSGPWNPHTLGGLFDLVSDLARPATLVSNFATRYLWGAHATPAQLLGYLIDGVQDGPPPDWDVGHFACVVGRAEGPGGSLYGVADTYPSLGNRGVHLQPAERLAAALERRDMPAGGMIVTVDTADAPAVRAGAGVLGLAEGIWDNGTVTAEPLP